MKYFLALSVMLSGFAVGGTHKLILSFQNPIDLQTELASYDVLGWKQLHDQPVYKVVINSTLSKSQLKQQIYNQIYADVEDNQHAPVVTLESSALIDSRAIFFIDDAYDQGIYQVSPATLNSRAIFFIDESTGAEDYTALYSQYHVTQSRADYCWEFTQGRGVKVAIIDTGVDYTHPFLAPNMVPGYDFVDEDSDPMDERDGIDNDGNGKVDEGWGHGTHVAGIVKMIAPEVQLMPIRVASSDGEAELFDIIQGIQFAIVNGAKVINLSMSIDEPSDELQYWIDVASYYNVLIVTSAGNANANDVMFPATDRDVVTVTSLDPYGHKADYANYDQQVDVAAPGNQIISCLPGGGYVSRSGTSMSAPIISGEAALLYELVPNETYSYVARRIKNKTYDMYYLNSGYMNQLGKGFVDCWDVITVQNMN